MEAVAPNPQPAPDGTIESARGTIELVGYVDRSTAAAVLFRIASVQDVPVPATALGQSIWLPRRAVHCFRDRNRRTICSCPRRLFARKLDELPGAATDHAASRAASRRESMAQ
jgi:hypothetical protein